jgi:hypothetical protein
VSVVASTLAATNLTMHRRKLHPVRTFAAVCKHRGGETNVDPMKKNGSPKTAVANAET